MLFERIDNGKPTHAEIPSPTTFRSPDGNTRFRVHNGLYSDALARKICQQIMLKKSLRSICEGKSMPSWQTVTRWLSDPRLADFREMYYYARRVQAELLVDEIIEIADNTDNDWIETYDKKGKPNGWKPDNEAIQRSRVRIDTRKWFAAKMAPRIYGDHVDVTHDVTGDLAELLKNASNKDSGLPEPVKVIEQDK